jgi:hypothetical protein
VSEFEQPGRMGREPTVEDVRQLMGASTPHFATHLRNRIGSLIAGLPPEHPARVLGEREIVRLDDVALGSERRGAPGHGERGMPSLRGGHVPESDTDTGAA